MDDGYDKNEGKSSDEDFLADVREKFKRSMDAEDDNRRFGEECLRFVKLPEEYQWPTGIKKEREEDGRPCLTFNQLGKFARKVVNEARSNRPAIQVVPADSGADPDTAEIISGLIRNIEVASDAEIAYDTAVEGAALNGFGYIRVNLADASDDNAERDISIERILDPFTVYADPDAESADGSDWNCCFISKMLHEDEFERRYKDAEKVDWTIEGYNSLDAPWRNGDYVMVAEYWHREDVETQAVVLSDGRTMDADEYAEQAELLTLMGVQVAEEKTITRKKVTQYILTGAEVLETVEWPGKYIPIVPVYGDEFCIDGERYFRPLVADALDANRDYNYWRSCASETIALAPKVPFIGPRGAFDLEPEKWSTINRKSWPYVEYDGPVMPQRVPPVTPPSGELQQAAAAVDDIKSILGIYDASLGERSNETSGVAIRARQQQSEVGTFHFFDNLARSIRHVGRILIDLVPRVYSTQRIIRILGEDMQPTAVQIAPQDEQQELMQRAMERGQQIGRIYDLSAGRYDLVVKQGPSFSTQREYARAEIAEIIRTMGEEAGRILAPLYLRNSDWPGADDIADKLEQMAQPQPQQGPAGPDPAVMQQMQRMAQELQKLAGENQQLKLQLQNKSGELQIDAAKVQVDAQNAAANQQRAQASLVGSMAKAQASQQPPNPFGMG